MKQRPEYLVVMTASVAPGPSPHIIRADPKLRLNDYKNSLRFWLEQPHPKINRILFLENTGYDLSELRKVASDYNTSGKEVEFVSMRRNDIPEGRHYGYGEMLMLDHGLPQSSLRQRTSHMIKATGRLTFPNIGKLIDRLPDRFDACIECRIPLNSFRSNNNPLQVIRQRLHAYASCQLMIFSHRFFEEQLQKLYLNLGSRDSGGYPFLIENLIYDRIIEFEGRTGIHLRWPINVEPAGFAGHSGKRYDSAGRLLIHATRAAARVLAPKVWI
jgi:hypothetical protein